MIKAIAGAILVVWGYLDAIKYHIEAVKIRKTKTTVGRSRWFINLALGNDIYRIYYFIFIDNNIYVLITALLATMFMLEMFWEIYKNYPYKMRGCPNFKRPNIWVYFLNSLQSNKIRKRL
jgi:hypothetical protein